MRSFPSRFDKSSPAIVHSNGFADAADKGTPSFGSTSSETFSQRLTVDRNRQHVDRFQNARIHHEYRTRPATSLPTTTQENDTTVPSRAATPIAGRTVILRTSAGFREPSSRGFNPFR